MDQEKREYLGREVRNVWVAFAKEQADPKPSHLVGWNELDEDNKEVDRRIGEHMVEFALPFAVLHPAEWPKPAYSFGQSVMRHAHGGVSLVSVIGMRFRTASKWEYQLVEIINGKPDVYCNGRWYPEAMLSEVGNV